jgi:hypothetical protein
MDAIEVPETACPSCHGALNMVSSGTVDTQPKADDFTICGNCASVLVFTADLGVRALTMRDMARLTVENCMQIEMMRQQMLRIIIERTHAQALLN